MSLELDQGQPTKAKILNTIEKVVKWKQVAQALKTSDGEEKIQMMENELQRLMAGLGCSVKTVPSKRKTSKSFFLSLYVAFSPNHS